MLVRSVVLAWLVSGCIDAGLSRCPTSGRICGVGLVCEDATDTCVSSDVATCGNSSIDANEECDDGNHLSHDGCSSGCQLEAPTWRTIGAPTPLGREGIALAYDANRGRVIGFGGRDSGTFPFATVEWDGSTWLATVPTPSPPVRMGAAMAYDPKRRAVVMFGGYGTSGFLDDTWAWDGAAWTQLAPTTGSPAARSESGMVTLGDGILLSGGHGSQEFADSWKWRSGQWGELTGLSTQPPETDTAALAVYGSGALLFGGSIFFLLSDTWIFDGAAWRNAASAGPSARIGHDVASAGAERVLLYGGSDSNVGQELGDTWLFEAGAWRQLQTSTDPGLRQRHAMVYDARHRYVLLYGGVSSALAKSDTWMFRYERDGELDETCVDGVDTDMDGDAGCMDADCWALCRPMCAPGSGTCDDTQPHCGDGVCNASLEVDVCPKDCP